MTGNVSILIAALVVMLLTSCDPQPEVNLDEAKKITVEQNYTDQYREGTRKLFKHYFGMKDALVYDDSLMLYDEGVQFVLELDEMPYNIVPEEDKFLWLDMMDTIMITSKGVVESKTMAEKRRSFQLLSESMYIILTEVGADSMTVYRQYCPMAFDGKGAAWLSNKPVVLNPYFGKAMRNCGTVEEVITVK